MKNIFITNIEIENVRHLKNITISLSQDKFKHLIFTGIIGSGKTSVLQALSNYLNAAASSDDLVKAEKLLNYNQEKLQKLKEQGIMVKFRKRMT